LILAKTDSDYLTIVCEEADRFWWVISAFPSEGPEKKIARQQRVGEEI